MRYTVKTSGFCRTGGIHMTAARGYPGRFRSVVTGDGRRSGRTQEQDEPKERTTKVSAMGRTCPVCSPEGGRA
jgi:hypothetical protein